ncbi:G-type lectin S-receptor-like serine/threonine-protein kinase At4g27290 isoform X1 [Syzygium oleosum]|uniref:G-type lectin S-receptor-like serine/threonine-protein kinase At4g27290 isoform X1 n=2 Tax=Syzygium oleosum TaxID=219896 RepID=UPI0024BAAEAF|nr:G-type lectin S-receptor-like serine/threonine-protein kinase At4g27290 isoform X1 [Syzygium oleosum]
MEAPTFFIFLFIVCLSTAADTLSSGWSMKDGETLVSSGQSFVLGFFSPGNSQNRYVGIWYKITPEIVVWVANRDNPLTDSHGVLTFSRDGDLVLVNQSNGIIWSSNLSRVLKNPVAQLLDTGNLVLRENTGLNSDVYSWQSFDHPSDTLLPGMKLGWDLKIGLERRLTSWKSMDDPSPGDYTCRLNIHGLPQVELVSLGSSKKYRSGSWNGKQFSGASVGSNEVTTSVFVYGENEIFFAYEARKSEFIARVLTMNHSGLLQYYVASKRSNAWTIMYSSPNNPCDAYGTCGANGICRANRAPICDCLKGFVPKSPEEWDLLICSGGCMRRIPVDCSKEEGFLKLAKVKLPDLLEFWLNKNMSLKECASECLKNCSCTAYANSDVRGGGSGCLLWFGSLIDIREYEQDDYGQTLYIRLPKSELDFVHNSAKKKRMVITVLMSAIAALFLLAMVYCRRIWNCRIKRKGSKIKEEDIDLPLFDLATIVNATNGFSEDSLIGAGGFGPVYKGNLFTGQEVAVKRLSRNSGQGLEEFKNETILIAKLQHWNLVGLLGCCMEREERILVYEYMQNKSLDYFIFDRERCLMLDWEKRFDIIIGIAKGLLYLHHDSKLRVIHRDLKASNILLDGSLSPRISDFGLARIFASDEKEAKTKRIIGTYGYMSPEYAFDGKFSVKSDIFSFGVLLLEIVSGKRNRGFCHPNHHHNLLGHAWLLWSEDRAMELVDGCLDDSVEPQVQRCIHIGLLCVQKFPNDRPAMSSVVAMLGNESASLPRPKQPGFFMERSSMDLSTAPTHEELHSINAVTVTMLDGR